MTDRVVDADGAVAEMIEPPSFTWGAVTHVGGVRDHNEDAFYVSDDVCVVADGMGGHEAGEVASQLVTKLVSEVFASHRLNVLELPRFISGLNAAVLRTGAENNTRGMGTTVVGVAVADNGESPSAIVFHVGDSRCYRLADGVMTQITTDHSHVQDLVNDGRITPAEALVHPLRNVITRALGADVVVEADFHVLVEEDCRLLLCSDGLSGEIDEDRIWELLTAHPDPSDAARALVEAVLEGPARDNVTAIVLDVRFPEVDPTGELRRPDPVPVTADPAEVTADPDITADISPDITAEIRAETPADRATGGTTAPVADASTIEMEPGDPIVDPAWAPPVAGQRLSAAFGRPPAPANGAAWAVPNPPSPDQHPQ